MKMKYNDGIISFRDLYDAGILSDDHNKQIEHELFNCEPYIE